jgi:alpha-tubulin suppressor-like RCC1 family protein
MAIGRACRVVFRVHERTDITGEIMMVGDEHEERALPGSPRGTLLSWGSNSAGQLGDGTTTNRAAPAPVPGVRNVVAVAAGAGFVLAVLSNGTVVAWGSNSNGQLGNGTKEDRLTAQPVPGLRDVIAVAAGSAHSLALRANGELLAWGRNISGQLGIGSEGSDQLTPVPVQGLAGATIRGIDAGENFSGALRSDGALLTWGENSSGQLGNGTTDDRSTPAVVANLIRIHAFGMGRRHTTVLTTTGVVRSWGENSRGQLGTGNTIDATAPVTTSGLDRTEYGIVAGGEHTVVLTARGNLRVWGENDHGQLGNGDDDPFSTLPVDVPFPGQGVIAVAAGADHNLALRDTGAVVAWGSNSSGQVGDGSGTDQHKPVEILPGGVVGVAAGNFFSIALV